MERLPKREYFTQRLAQAIKNGNTRKAEYYSRRLSEMFEGEAKFEYVPSTKTMRVYHKPSAERGKKLFDELGWTSEKG
tara:strand:- start:225 stop:458 length:234 start_codon:yes stop_codon:yes gene_type:complete